MGNWRFALRNGKEKELTAVLYSRVLVSSELASS